MELERVTAPGVEPVSVTEAKAHLRVSGSSEDTYIGALIKVATEHAESYLNRCLVQQTWSMILDEWPTFPLAMPLPPLMSVETINYYDAAGSEYVLDPEVYYVVPGVGRGWVDLVSGKSLPTTTLRRVGGVKITFLAGSEPVVTEEEGEEVTDYVANIPQDIRHAILMLVAHWYENREDVMTDVRNVLPTPRAAEALLNMHRVWPV